MDNTRSRAWRLAQNKRNRSRDTGSVSNEFPKEKNWKMLYIRSEKLNRAVQLGIDYPRVSNAQLMLKAKDDI